MSEVIRGAAPVAATRPVDLSILIVTWNSERWIERCLSAIGPACDGVSYEVIVHDNASSDSTVPRIDDSFARVLRAESNIGFSAATNRARSLAEIPVLSLDQITLKRENRREGTVHAELRLTLHRVKS